MDEYTINSNDIKERVYFITKLVQNQKGSTMQGALTSKSDSMGGIFDRFINTLSDSLVFEKIILQKKEFKSINKKIELINDYYYYKAGEKQAGIAPDIFGIKVDGVPHPFTIFDNKWESVPNTPQIEVKTFKAKDQMISLRNQNYDDMFLVLVDLDLRIDYLVPFLDSKILNNSIADNMVMDDSVFIKNDDKGKITKLDYIDFSNKQIGTLKLISVTNADDFMNQATLCESNISVYRMKSISKRKTKIRANLLHDKLSNYANKSQRLDKLYEFNSNWLNKFNILNNVKCLDFSADNIDDIEISKFNSNGIVIASTKGNCSFNGEPLIKGEQYTLVFEILDRSGNDGQEYFMQKQCACHLKGVEQNLIDELLNVIKGDN